MSDPALSHEIATAGWPADVLAWVGAVPPALRNLVERVERVWLPATDPPWTDSGVALRAGQWFSLLAKGRVLWSPAESDQWAGPRHHLWGRVGTGPVFNPTQDTTTRRAVTAGSLYLSLLHGFWKDEGGELATSERAYRHLRGGIDVLVVVWRSDPRVGLAAAAACGDAAQIRAEAERFADPVETPEGWAYLLETGSADVYQRCETPFGAGIAVESVNDQGILRKAVDLPLEPETRIRWRWRLDEFPSRRAENEVSTHDYLSIAVEFDNGRDLTWFWSRCLAPGTHFGCPVRSWNYREIHYCVRSGEAGMGAWQGEERRIAGDCDEALGEVPGRLVAVWLIVVSSFQHGTARGAFADIRLEGPGGTLQVL